MNVCPIILVICRWCHRTISTPKNRVNPEVHGCSDVLTQSFDRLVYICRGDRDASAVRAPLLRVSQLFDVFMAAQTERIQELEQFIDEVFNHFLSRSRAAACLS